MRYVRKRVHFSTHSRVHMCTHKARKYGSRIMAGRRENCTSFVSLPPNCFTLLPTFLFSPSTNLFLPAFSSFQHPLYTISLLSYSVLFLSISSFSQLCSLSIRHAKSTKEINKKKLKKQSDLNIWQALIKRKKYVLIKSKSNIRNEGKLFNFYLHVSFAPVFFNQVVQTFINQYYTLISINV